MDDNLLEIHDLAVEYHTDDDVIYAVNNIELAVRKGETLGLVGETGAGKTTIAKSILRILPMLQAKLVSGNIVFDGDDLLELSERAMRKIRGNKIAMIFQDPMTALNPIMRIVDQISEVIIVHSGLSKSDAEKKANGMLELVGIPTARGVEYPHQFSGGMKQRVVIAIALACSPKLLIADEPTTALDVTIQAQVLRMMNELKKEFDSSMLLITHDLGVVAETCDSVAIMYAGEIIEYGSLEQIFDKTAHPYTHGLFGALPSLEKDVDRLNPIGGLMPDPANLPKGCKFHPRCPDATEACASHHPKTVGVGQGHLVKCLKYGGKEAETDG